MSWTLDYGVACWFAKRFETLHGPGRVVRAECRKSDIHCLLLRRGEVEIVVHPDKLSKFQEITRPSRPDWLGNLWDACERGHALRQNPRTHHGPAHWFKVETNGLAIASKLAGCDLDVIRAFAVLHDCMRINEDDDQRHGARAAALCRRLHRAGDLPLTESQLAQLVHACAHHTGGDVSSDPTIGACWDADRLDLLRVGIVPDRKYFSSAAAFDLRFRT